MESLSCKEKDQVRNLLRFGSPVLEKPAGKDGPQTQVTRQQSSKLLGNQIWPDSQSDCM